jgi:histone acetyltransferase (RNA polymerase elongator complex component)
MRHFNIPVFIPELACPFRCVFCNQYSITSKLNAPTTDEVKTIIENHLETLPVHDAAIEVAFFGGSFTGLGIDEQNKYLDVVQTYMHSGRISGIRISTRPDYVTSDILKNLKNKGVVAVELGAQSLNDKVLKLSGRGHTAQQVELAAYRVKEKGFELGLQMMTGLPGDTDEYALETAHRIVELNADTTRIYPTLVIADTPLANIYKAGKYCPQTLEDAVNLSAKLFLIFINAGVKVLRTGLHPSDNFLTGEKLLAGPFHVAFGEMVMTHVWQERFSSIDSTFSGRAIQISVHPAELNAAIGHKAVNKEKLKSIYKKVRFATDLSLKKGTYYVHPA